MAKSAASQLLSQPQIPNSVPSNALDAIFQKCFTNSLSPLLRNSLPSAQVTIIEREAIQNMTGHSLELVEVEG